jgi:hypothetical protein
VLFQSDIPFSIKGNCIKSWLVKFWLVHPLPGTMDMMISKVSKIIFLLIDYLKRIKSGPAHVTTGPGSGDKELNN